MPVARGGPQGGASCFDKIKLGFLMGASVGAGAGILFGGFNVWRLGLRGREAFTNLGKVMASSGGSFGVFMAVGQGIRC